MNSELLLIFSLGALIIALVLLDVKGAGDDFEQD